MERNFYIFLFNCLLIFGGANAAFAGNALQSNWAMPLGSRINSSNGCFSLVQQTDGNAVLYNNSRRQALWSTGTYNRSVKHTIMQSDGNLVVYDTSGLPIFATGTERRGGITLIMQDDGNLVMYAPGGRVVWASNTVSSCGAAPQTPVNPPVSSTPRSITEARPFHKLQNYDPQLNPQATSSNNNCGPASVAAVTKLFGKEAANSSTQQSINMARQYMGVPQNPNLLTGTDDIERGLKNAGLRTGNHIGDGNWGILDKDLGDNMAVIAWGYWSPQWRSLFPNYNYGNSGTDHFISIVGKTPNGNYLVLDPMYRGGAVEMSRDRLAVFFSYGDGYHNGVPSFITVAK